MPARKILACALLVSLAACEEALGPNAPGTSSFVFDYTGIDGEPAATFAAEGELPPDQGPDVPPGDWAFAFRRGAQDQRIVVTASRDRSDGRFDAMTLELPADAQRGQTLQFTELCDNEPGCAKMWISFGVTSGSAQTLCLVVSGQARVQALTSRRVAGSFSGTATCTGAYTGQTQIQRGAFDVAVLAPDA